MAPIVLSGSSSSSNESYSSDNSSSSDTDTQASTLLSSRRYHRRANCCFIVSIPLSLIQNRLKRSPEKAPRESSLDTKLSVEKPLTNGSELALSPANLKSLRMPLSLKLKRMSPSNSYAIISSNVNGMVTNRSLPAANSGISAITCSTSTNTSTIADSRVVTLTESRPPFYTSTATSNVRLEPVAASPSVTASLSVSGQSVTGVSKPIAEQEPACLVASPGKGHACAVSVDENADLSSEFDLLNPRPKLSLMPAIPEDTSATLPKPGMVQDSNGHPVSSPMSVENGSPPTNEENSAPTGANGTCQPSSVDSRPTVAFSFNRLFSFYPSDLKLQDNELVPVYSLSLKNADTIPEDHPVYTWTIGQAVESPRKRKKSFNH